MVDPVVMMSSTTRMGWSARRKGSATAIRPASRRERFRRPPAWTDLVLTEFMIRAGSTRAARPCRCRAETRDRRIGCRWTLPRFRREAAEEGAGTTRIALADLDRSKGLISPLLRSKSAKAILVVPAPSSAASLRKRGRVHLQPILLSLVSALQRQGLAARVEPALIMNSVRTKSVQAGGRRNRSRRLAGRIAVADPLRLADHPILVVDDIITTGSTIRQCARALETAGALPLAALALAAVSPGHEDL